MLMRQRSLGEVIDFCSSKPNWEDDLHQFRFIILQNEASRIFYDRHHPGGRNKTERICGTLRNVGR
jgi:hypothetical protein